MHTGGFVWLIKTSFLDWSFQLFLWSTGSELQKEMGFKGRWKEECYKNEHSARPEKLRVGWSSSWRSSENLTRIGQLYMISKHSHEQSDRGEGVEVVQNEPYEDPTHGCGQFTEKRLYLNRCHVHAHNSIDST
ncbi:hypothetical protein Z043_103322 [Scleropages formosus]|uniref:Phosphatidylinositol transfer protein N-terminal domain-containing protein n=1 Tax=Scleropages formosus TaxID=113540 RepID=A0A0P7XPM8_SCLFO|nr:hypothetical protein Z043_103322 [Scleropages formosus]